MTAPDPEHLDSTDAISAAFRERGYITDRSLSTAVFLALHLERPLLRIRSDFQVTVPEIGTVRAEKPPRVILTSNRTREVHDALKRRCLYHWIDYPTEDKEFEIVLARVPNAPEALARRVVAFVHRLRGADLTKVPGIAETLDWAAALLSLGATELSPQVVDETLGVVLKYEEDIRHVRGQRVRELLAEPTAR